MAKIDADNMKWSKGTGSSGMFDEVFQAKDTYDKFTFNSSFRST